MKSKYKIIDILMWLPLIAAILVYPFLDAVIPARLSMSTGEAVDFSPKIILPILTLTNVALGIIIKAVLKTLQSKLSTNNDKLAMATGTLAMLLLDAFWFLIIYYCLFYSSQVPTRELPRFIWICTGAVITIFGAFFQNTKFNPHYGIRTRWTILCPENWAKTHRAAGILIMCMGGSIMLVNNFIPNTLARNVISMFFLLAIIPACFLLAYIIQKSQRPNN